MANDQHRSDRTLLIPTALLILFGIAIWGLVFASSHDSVAPALDAPSEDQLNGVEAAEAAINLVRDAVPGEDGLLGGRPDRISVRHDGRGISAYWTVFIQGQVRHRPNTVEEFTIQEGEVVIEVSAFTGYLSGNFSTGVGVLRNLRISDEGFVPIPVSSVWLVD